MRIKHADRRYVPYADPLRDVRWALARPFGISGYVRVSGGLGPDAYRRILVTAEQARTER